MYLRFIVEFILNWIVFFIGIGLVSIIVKISLKSRGGPLRSYADEEIEGLS